MKILKIKKKKNKVIYNYNLETIKRVTEEYKDLSRNPNLNIGLTIALEDEDNIFEWIATLIGAKDSSYRGGLFYLKVIFPNDYPNRRPLIKFLTPIYHANVYLKRYKYIELGYIDLSTLNNWRPDFTMRKVFLDIFVLINYCGNQDCFISDIITKEMRNNRELYEEKKRYFTKKYANPLINHRNKYSKLDEWDFTYDK